MNNDFSGPIPASLLQLEGLSSFYIRFNESLCVPGTSAFIAWLQRIERRDEEVISCNAVDMAALKSLFEATGGADWLNSNGWLGDSGVEEWRGVSADSLGHVTELDLARNGLAGRIPSGLGDLGRMTVLRIGGNALSGRLPSALTRLPLREFHYANTDLCAPDEDSFQSWLNGIGSHEGTGVGCAPLTDREILEILYEATDGPNWNNSENWLTDAALENWYGVVVDGEGRVFWVALDNNNLTGSIPGELGRLSHLGRLNLGSNNLTGPIPPELGRLVSLGSLVLQRNDFSGPIPPELGELTNLRFLWAGDAGLTGSMPAELGNLADLEGLNLVDNNLTGPIPPELGSLADLRDMYLHGNELTGPIPPELGNLAQLSSLSLGRNDLSGPIPRTLDGLRSLAHLSLDQNRLEGPIPPELGDLTDLRFLYLGHNQLTGPVPGTLGGLAELETLAFSNNVAMSGALPSSLTNLASLETLEATGTALCAPSDPSFLRWLNRLASPRVTLCESQPASAYLVQAVQSRELPVPLVAGEEALLRVFVTASRDNSERLPPVRASFYRNAALVHVADIPRGHVGPIPTQIDESFLSKSANAVIPPEVVRPGLEMVVEIDPDGTIDAELGVPRRIPESGRLALDVADVPLFDLTLVPFLWTEAPDSAILEAVAQTVADPEDMLFGRAPYLPVGELDVRSHEPVLSSSNSAYDLLSQTRAIRAMEGGTGYYMGTMSRPVTGAAGVAQVGGKVSFSLIPGPTAHELGHNFSLRHAPCGGAGGPDPAYPYEGAEIGVWGYDPRDGGRLVTPTTTDIMSYCGGWISDYHYTKALRHRERHDGAESDASATSLLLWGGTDGDGLPHLEPAFVVDAPPALPDSAGVHRITGWTAGGSELFSLSFTMPEIADGDGSSSFAFVLPVRPRWAGSLASITLNGPGGAVTLDGGSDRPMAILRDPRSGRVRAILRDVPDPARTQAVASTALGAGPGLEVLFSRGIPETGAWRK